MILRPLAHAAESARRVVSSSRTAVWRRAALAPAAAGLTVGIVADRARIVPAWTCGAVAIVVIVMSLVAARRWGWSLLLVFALFACLGALRHGQETRDTAPRNIRRLLDASRPFEVLRVRGEVCSTPRVSDNESFAFSLWTPTHQRSTFLMRVESAEGNNGAAVAMTGRVRVSVDEPLNGVRLGDEVEAFGRVQAFRPALNPGGFDAAEYFRREGVDAAMSCSLSDNVRIVGTHGFTAASALSRVRGWFDGLMREDWPDASDDTRGLMQTMVLGRRGQLDRRIDELFMDLGLTHLLAVSGMNFAAVMFGAWVLARLVALGHRGTTLALSAVAGTYIVAVEPAAPVLRAAIAAAALLTARCSGRRVRPVNIVCACLLLLLMVSPQQLFSPGFQLSFAATLGIITLTPAGLACANALVRQWQARGGMALAAELRRRAAEVQRRTTSTLERRRRTAFSWITSAARRLGRGCLRWMAMGLVVSMAAWIATAPLIVAHFNQVQWAGPVNSMIAGPAMSLLIDIGFGALVLDNLAPGLGAPLKQSAVALADPLMRMLEALPRGWPWIASAPGPPWWAVVAWYAGLIVFALGVAPPGEREAAMRESSLPPVITAAALSWRRWRRQATTAAATLSLMGLGMIGAWPRHETRNATVCVLAVGHGLATTVELPDGRTLLYDAGSEAAFDVGRGVILPYLRSRGISRIDDLFISHADMDHFSGVPGLIEVVPVGTVHVTPYFLHHHRPGSPVQHLIDLLCERGQHVETLDADAATTYADDPVKLEVLWPPPDLPVSTSDNDQSLVMRVAYAGHAVLLTGDIEDFAQRGLLRDPRLAVDVLVLPHHGSVRASSRAFVEAARAGVLIQSAGASSASFPLSRAGQEELFRTAGCGAVTVGLGPDGVRVHTHRPPPQSDPGH